MRFFETCGCDIAISAYTLTPEGERGEAYQEWNNLLKGKNINRLDDVKIEKKT